MGFLQMLSALLGLLPNILNAVRAIEVAMPDATGPTKLDAVTATIRTAAAHTAQTIEDVQGVTGAIQTLASEVVSVFNAAGIFTHKAPAAIAPAAPAAPAAPDVLKPAAYEWPENVRLG